MKKIVFYGKSGSGKSTTCSNAIKYYQDKGKKVQVIKLAYPLYVLQKEFYDIAEVNIRFYDQNQALLESIASHLREINPNSIISNFSKRLSKSEADIIINDDLRDTKIDYPTMKEAGFIFIKICCNEELREKRLRERNDLNTIFDSRTTNFIDEIEADYVIDTSNEDKAIIRKELYKILEFIE